MAKSKSSVFNSSKIATVVIYLSLLAVLGTYVLPLQSITLPAIGKKAWSVQDIVKTLPIPKGGGKGGPAGEEKQGAKLDIDFDFMDFVKEISPKKEGTGAPAKVSPEFIFGALIPIALVLAYLFAILSLLVASLKNRSALVSTAFISAVSAAYVLVGTFYLSASARKAFSASMAKVEDSPFGAIAKNFVQEVSIQPETGLYALVGLTVLVLLVALYRRNQA